MSLSPRSNKCGQQRVGGIATLYVVTNRRRYSANESQARSCLLNQTAIWAANRVNYIQLREKDLSARDLVHLAGAMRQAIRAIEHSPTRLLINGRADIALASDADGVHLPGGPDELTPDEVRRIFAAAKRRDTPTISISCHTLAEVETAKSVSPDCVLFAPVFEKRVGPEIGSASSSPQLLPGCGLELLQEACQLASPIPVFALGGVNSDNAAECLRAGASGIAAIRLFQQPPSVWRSLG